MYQCGVEWQEVARAHILVAAHIGGTLLPLPPLRPEQPQDMHLLLAIATFVGAATVCIITNLNTLSNICLQDVISFSSRNKLNHQIFVIAGHADGVLPRPVHPRRRGSSPNAPPAPTRPPRPSPTGQTKRLRS